MTWSLKTKEKLIKAQEKREKTTYSKRENLVGKLLTDVKHLR